jgi:hypothetical protein
MKLKLCACLAMGALLIGTQALAAPLTTPFLAVDINGYNAGGGQSIGPTAAGFQGLEAAEGLFLDPSIDWGNSGAAGLTKVFSTSVGNITANLRGIAPSSTLGARNRGANTGALTDAYQDFVFAQRNVAGFGQHFVRVALSGLTPNQAYEVTTYAREPFNGGTGIDSATASFEAWTDRAALGGLDGPGAWMDANVGAGALYQPVFTDADMDPMTPDVNTGYKNPIPTLARTPISGPDSADQYAYAATFTSTADAGGVVTFYGFADPNGYSGTQTASLLNGFQVGIVPEPASAALLAVAFVGVAGLRRRVR